MKSIAALIFLVCPATSWAAPLNIEVTMTGGTEFAAHPLAGANILVHASWDPSTLTPLHTFSSGTYSRAIWPATNTSITMDVTGSAGHDGHYVGRVIATPTAGWYYTNNDATFGDAILFPQVYFTIGGSNISFNTRSGDLRARLAANHFNGADLPLPGPFAESDASWELGPIFSSTSSSISANNISGFAIQVPEPTCFALAGTAVAAVRLVRRRK